MSIPLLKELSQETRRLAVAGSGLAAGDFRLKRLLEPLDKAGEKAPVFANVAKAVRGVVESKEADSPAALLGLTTLVNAILYTQGATGLEGELTDLPESPLKLTSTKTTARVLQPIVEALTSTGLGRLEIVTDAHERGAFQDLRLVLPAIRGLDDLFWGTGGIRGR